MTMLELCMECRNFHKPNIYAGDYTISGGMLEPLPDIPDGAWIRIVGSVSNDGVYQYPAANLTDEEFRGAVWLMHVPPDFVALLDDINAWETANADAVKNATAEMLTGPFTAESFADYSYQRKNALPDVPTTWKDPRLGFAARINRWRKI